MANACTCITLAEAPHRYSLTILSHTGDPGTTISQGSAIAHAHSAYYISHYIYPCTTTTAHTPLVTPTQTLDSISFIGDASYPLPEALHKRILNPEYVDMADLRPETWVFCSDTEPNAIHSLFYRRKQPVNNIAI